MTRVNFNITGLSEFEVSFQDYCSACPMQKNCKYGKSNPFGFTIDCKELTAAEDFKKTEKSKKIQNDHPEWDWDKAEAASKVKKSQIFSKVWEDKVKSLKEEILCMDSRRTDSMLTSQRGEEWWSEFRTVMTKIHEECSKIY